MNKNFQNLISALEEAIIVIEGNKLTEGEKMKKKELVKQLYFGARNYVQGNRFNVDLAEEILKRKFFFNPHFNIEAIDEKMKNHLIEKFSLTDPSEKEAERIWNRFKEAQTYSRNEALPYYMREYVNKYKSGVNSEEDVLNKIWQKTVEDRISHNAKQVNIVFI
jgi:hypothetical protein